MRQSNSRGSFCQVLFYAFEKTSAPWRLARNGLDRPDRIWQDAPVAQRPTAPPGGIAMILEQILLSRMDTFCYFIGDEFSGYGALIDPAFDVPRILETVRRAGYTVTHVINTHHHADHTAGNAEVLRATGARLYIHTADAAALGKMTGRTFARMLGGKGSPPADKLLGDGDRIKIGATELKVLHTPGHTPGSICLYTAGHCFTGDTLFVGAVGRTDLAGGSARQLLASIQNKIYTLPEETIVWPGHDYGDTPSSTVGAEKRSNPFTR
jgi:glyoxylase-like metal-dependent hydrolase (beta-lactamase superfamily II)